MALRLSKPVRLFFLHISISFFVADFVLLLTQNILFEFPPLKSAELSLIDLRFQQRGVNQNLKTSPKIIIVEKSKKSFDALPAKWPWPQTYYTRLVRNLKRAGAKAIGIDILFSASDSIAANKEFLNTLRDAGNVVLAGELEVEDRRSRTQEYFQNYGNIFIEGTSNIGLVNAREDVDGILRRYMPFWNDVNQQRLLPTFSLAILNIYFGQKSDYILQDYLNNFYYLDQPIPKYDATSFLINYSGPSGTFPTINIADVLDDKDFKTVDEITHPGEETNTFDDPDYGYLYDGTFKDKIVLVGSTVPEDKDLFPTPIAYGKQEGDNKMYGVEMHANVIQSILDNNFIVKQPFWMTAFIVFGLTLFTFVFTERLKAIRTTYSALIEILGVAIILAEMYIIYWASLKLFIEKNFLADMTSPLLAVIVSYIGSTVYNYVSERKQKILIKSMFSRYVNPTIVDELVAHPEKLRLGGERKELTVFFTDIETFTQTSEKMAPEDLVTILNEYLSAMTAIILTNDGTLDKYEGDAIVAFWGAPIPQTDHALRACRTAVQMQESLKGFRQIWQNEGKPPLYTRIGINTGEVIVGNMGGATRFDYTIIGDSVNLGARLEGANKQYKTNIMISENTFTAVQSKVYARELDLLVVAGKTEPIRVYELIGMADEGIAPAKKQFIEIYNSALKLYRQRDWDEAVRGFEKALSIVPDDFPSQMYVERSQFYKSSPPPSNWNGVFFLRTK